MVYLDTSLRTLLVEIIDQSSTKYLLNKFIIYLEDGLGSLLIHPFFSLWKLEGYQIISVSD